MNAPGPAWPCYADMIVPYCAKSQSGIAGVALRNWVLEKKKVGGHCYYGEAIAIRFLFLLKSFYPHHYIAVVGLRPPKLASASSKSCALAFVTIQFKEASWKHPWQSQKDNTMQTPLLKFEHDDIIIRQLLFE